MRLRTFRTLWLTILMVGVAISAGGPMAGIASADAPDCSTVSFAGGDGTEANPYEIATVDQLQCIASGDTSNTAHFELVADIDASGTDSWNGGAGFAPIKGFSGTFDGNDHRITGLTIERSGEQNVGLFATVEAALIHDVTLVNVRVVGSGDYFANPPTGTGAVTGFLSGDIRNVSVLGDSTVVGNGDNVGGLAGAMDGGTIKNVYVTANIDGADTNRYAAGLVGRVEGGTIVNATTTGEVTGKKQVGGLVGFTFSNQRIVDSTATGAVTGTSKVGGLIGESQTTVLNSYATGVVSGTNRVGGLIGQNWEGTVKRSYATGAVNGSTAIGGLVGLHIKGTVKNTYSTGSVTGETEVGGLVGKNIHVTSFGPRSGTIRTSYATGTVTGEDDQTTGGIVGRNEVTSDGSTSTGTVDNAYWDVETTGQESSQGSPDANGLTTGEMTGSNAVDNMDGFDFENTWQTTDSYPALAWEKISDSDTGGDGSDSGTTSGNFSVTANGTTVQPNSTATVSFTLTNLKDEKLPGPAIQLKQTPDEFTIIDRSDDGATYKEDTQTWLWLNIRVGESRTPSLTFDIPNATEPGNYTVKATGTGPSGVNKAVTATIEIRKDKPKSVSNAIAGKDNMVGLREIQNAIQLWANNKPVPGTEGKTIGLRKIQELIQKWANNEPIGNS